MNTNRAENSGDGTPAWTSLWETLRTIQQSTFTNRHRDLDRTTLQHSYSLSSTTQTHSGTRQTTSHDAQSCIEGAAVVDGCGHQIAGFGAFEVHPEALFIWYWKANFFSWCVHRLQQHYPEERKNESNWMPWINAVFAEDWLGSRTTKNEFPDKTTTGRTKKEQMSLKETNLGEENDNKEPTENIMQRWGVPFDFAPPTDSGSSSCVTSQRTEDLYADSSRFTLICSYPDNETLIARSISRGNPKLVVLRRLPGVRAAGGGLFVFVLASRTRSNVLISQAKRIGRFGRAFRYEGNVISIILEVIDCWLQTTSAELSLDPAMRE